MRHKLHKESGLGLISAIFVIVILALLVGAMASFYSAGQGARVQEFLAAQALNAAQSGLDLEISQVLHPQLANQCRAAQAYTFTGAGLNTCRAQVACQSVSVDGQAYLTLTSTGTCGSGLDSARRQLEVRIAP